MDIEKGIDSYSNVDETAPERNPQVTRELELLSSEVTLCYDAFSGLEARVGSVKRIEPSTEETEPEEVGLVPLAAQLRKEVTKIRTLRQLMVELKNKIEL